jgi:hypothetical protein
LERLYELYQRLLTLSQKRLCLRFWLVTVTGSRHWNTLGWTRSGYLIGGAAVIAHGVHDRGTIDRLAKEILDELKGA